MRVLLLLRPPGRTGRRSRNRRQWYAHACGSQKSQLDRRRHSQREVDTRDAPRPDQASLREFNASKAGSVRRARAVTVLVGRSRPYPRTAGASSSSGASLTLRRTRSRPF